jgi:two-component system sensor histidine kinase ChiS
VEKEMTIMFSDIRSFTAISEKLSSEASFGFINDYLQTMAPIIRKHHGFIDKYIGDGIMALFPKRPDDAILCAKEMMQALKEFNSVNFALGKPLIEIGIGLHTGNCILGTVGEPKRMDTTVISDSVNLAARIESLTKHYKTPIIISFDTFRQIDRKHQTQIRYIGTAVVKGKSIHTDLYKVFLGEDILVQLMDQFDEAISLFYKKDFAKASALFLELSQSPLNDGVLQLYLQRSTFYEKEGTPEDWKTFEVFEY